MAQLSDGDILLCKGTDLIARLIKWGTGSVYSHVAVVASAQLALVVEAIPTGGVRAIYYKNLKTPHDIYRVRDGYPFNQAGVVSYLITTLARKYDTWGVLKLGFKLGLRRLRLIKLLGLKLIGHKAADDLQKDEDYFCSELCYKAFYFGGGLDIVPQIGDAETTSPGDIAESKIIEEMKPT